MLFDIFSIFIYIIIKVTPLSIVNTPIIEYYLSTDNKKIIKHNKNYIKEN